jgi:hypothetical protein
MVTRAIPLRLVILSIIIVLSSGCRRDQSRVNLSGINCDITVRDLGRDIFETPPPELSVKADSLVKSYGPALKTYSAVIGLGNPSDEKWKSSFILFATDLQNLALWDSVKKAWPTTKPLEESLEGAFRHYLYYFPGSAIPEVVTCVTAFNNSIVIDDSLLMIGLDRYLGERSKYYPALGIFEYQARKMTPAYTASDCMYAWASTEWDYRDMNYGTHTLLSSMLHEAKLLYFTRCMLPETPDTVLFGFKEKQLDFCKMNEARIWEYLISKDILFTTDGFVIRKFTGEAPFTSYFTEEAPGRTAVWTGYRIVERYMRNNRKVTLSELMKDTDCQAILEGAKYNPN